MAKDRIFGNGRGMIDGDDGEKMLFCNECKGPKPVSDSQKKYIRDIRRKNPYAPPFTGKTSAEASEYIDQYKGGMF